MVPFRSHPRLRRRTWVLIFIAVALALALPTILNLFIPKPAQESYRLVINSPETDWEVPIFTDEEKTPLTCTGTGELSSTYAELQCGDTTVTYVISEVGTNPQRTFNRLIRSILYADPPTDTATFQDGKVQAVVTEYPSPLFDPSLAIALLGSGENKDYMAFAFIQGSEEEVPEIAGDILASFTEADATGATKQLDQGEATQEIEELFSPGSATEKSPLNPNEDSGSSPSGEFYDV